MGHRGAHRAEPRARHSLVRHLVATGVLSVGIVVLNFVTGVLVTRTLGADGRGETSFLLSFVQTVGWLGALGINEGITYVAARDAHLARRIATTGSLLTLVLGTLGVVVAQLLLPVLASSQPGDTIEVGRVFAFTIYLNVASSLLLAVLSGCQDFGGRNVVQFLQPAVYMVIVVVMALAGSLDVDGVLIATAASTAVATVWAAGRIHRRIGFSRPSLRVTRESALYGLKVQGSLIGALVSTRLATVIMPTVLTYSAIGLYSVATNVSTILISVVGVLGNVVLPSAVRRGGREGALFVARMTRVVTFLSICVAVPMFVLAPWMLGVVYGQEFSAAGNTLRILLVSVVLGIASGILETGLQAVNRPLAASVSQLIGLVVTALGLLFTLERFGLTGAAGTALAAAAATFVTALLMMRAEPTFRLGEAFSPRGLAADVREGVHRFKGVLRRRRPVPSAR